jgi:hypothetical protein
MKKLFVSAAAIAIACAGVGAMAASKTPAKSTSFNPFAVQKPARYVLPTAKKTTSTTTTAATPAPAAADIVRPPYRPPTRSPYVPTRAGPFT